MKVDWHGMTEETLSEAIHKVLDDPSYHASVSKLSNLIMDQPLHPLDRAVWWLEYLLRHPHNPDMKTVTHELNWLQYFLLDVIAAILLIFTIIFLLIVKIISCLYNF